MENWMIDYEKLKMAHELAKSKFKMFKMDIFLVEGAITSMSGLLHYDYDLDSGIFKYYIKFAYVEQLLNALTELTKPEPKYKPNDVVFFSKDDSVCWFVASVATWDDALNEFCYGYHGDFSYRESCLFPTRQALIEHQLQYWKKMRDEL